MEEKTSKSYAVPVAIVIAGGLIAAALYYTQTMTPQTVTGPTPSTAPEQQEAQPISGVQADDHIIGNPDAELIIVEYSDFECPFCKNFHFTMHEVVDHFGDDVAWVYRQLPLTSLHAQAVAESVASECVAELGGNDAFWTFADTLYTETTSNDGLDLNKIPEYATAAGVDDAAAFAACLDDEEMLARVQADLDEAVSAGAQGTPFGVVLYKGQQAQIPGAIPFEDYQAGGQTQPGMKSIVEGLLAQ